MFGKKWDPKTGRGKSHWQRRRARKRPKLFKLSSPQKVTDGGVQNVPVTGTATTGLLLFSTGDLGLASAWDLRNRPAALLRNFSVDIHLQMDPDPAEAARSHMEMWLMAAPAVVFTDWTTNDRNPSDGSDAIMAVATAAPFQILSPIRQIDTMAGGADYAADDGRIRLTCRKAWVRWPFNVYLMYTNRYVPINQGADVLESGDHFMVWSLKCDLRRPITT